VKVFVDTSAFIALTDQADQYHQRSKQVLRDLKPLPDFHTSNYVLDEVITRLRFTAGVRVAVRFAEALWASRLYHIHEVASRTERDALALLHKYAGHPFSFTDCTTIVLMEQLGIECVFAFDEEFKKVGLLLLQ
jgi:predicted nucleic acid-binding protein